MFSDCSGFKLEINYRKISEKSAYIWKLNNTLLNKQWIKEKIRSNIIKSFEISESENTTY